MKENDRLPENTNSRTPNFQECDGQSINKQTQIDKCIPILWEIDQTPLFEGSPNDLWLYMFLCINCVAAYLLQSSTVCKDLLRIRLLLVVVVAVVVVVVVVMVVFLFTYLFIIIIIIALIFMWPGALDLTHWNNKI